MRKGSRCASRQRWDRKSTRLNSSHMSISYAVFCLKKKQHPRFVSDLISGTGWAPCDTRSLLRRVEMPARLRESVAQRQLWRHLCFFNDAATTEIYTLSLHAALPISV